MKTPPFINIPVDPSIMALGMLQADELAAEEVPVLISRRVAVLAGDGVDEAQVEAVRQVLQAHGAQVQVLSNRSTALRGKSGTQVPVDHHWLEMPSLMFDALYIPGGEGSVAVLQGDPDAVTFLQQAYEHGKSVAATGEGVALLRKVGVALPRQAGDALSKGIVTDLPDRTLDAVAGDFIAAIVKDRHWRRHDGEASAPLALAAVPSSCQGSVGFGPM